MWRGQTEFESSRKLEALGVKVNQYGVRRTCDQYGDKDCRPNVDGVPDYLIQACAP